MVRNPFEIAPADDVDDHDEHWDGDFHDEEHDEHGDDDDEEAFDGRPSTSRAPPVSLNGHDTGANMNGGLNGHHTTRNNKKKKMQKMKVSTQRDYHGPTVNIHMFNMFLWEPRTRGVCCLGSISFAIILLFIGWIIPKKEGSGSTTTQAPVAQCQIHTTHEPFSEWMHSIKVTNSTELCRSEVHFDSLPCWLFSWCRGVGVFHSLVSVLPKTNNENIGTNNRL